MPLVIPLAAAAVWGSVFFLHKALRRSRSALIYASYSAAMLLLAEVGYWLDRGAWQPWSGVAGRALVAVVFYMIVATVLERTPKIQVRELTIVLLITAINALHISFV